jgi:hypothetical protein
VPGRSAKASRHDQTQFAASSTSRSSRLHNHHEDADTKGHLRHASGLVRRSIAAPINLCPLKSGKDVRTGLQRARANSAR